MRLVNKLKNAVVLGESALSKTDKKYVEFTERFEREYVGQELTRTVQSKKHYDLINLSILPRNKLKTD